jgi:hypothetical protein
MGKVVPAALAAFALGGGLTACGGTSVDEVEDQVGSELKAQLEQQGNVAGDAGTPAAVDHVDCPDDADTSEGSMFRCRALDANDKVVGTVTVQMRADGKARWQFVVAAPQ